MLAEAEEPFLVCFRSFCEVIEWEGRRNVAD